MKNFYRAITTIPINQHSPIKITLQFLKPEVLSWRRLQERQVILSYVTLIA